MTNELINKIVKKQTMNITSENIITLLLDDRTRADIFKAIALENGTEVNTY